MQRIVLPSVNTKHLDTISFALLSVVDLLARRDVDIAHIHGIGPSVVAFIPRLKGIKSVVQVHGLDWQRAKWGWLAKAYLRASEYSSVYFPDATVVVYRTLRNYFNDRLGRSLCYIPQGVDAVEPREPDQIQKYGLDGGDYILFMARLVPEKGCHYLVQAYRGLQTDKKLVIAGGTAHSSSYAETLRRLARDDKRVVLVGHVTGTLKQELLSNAYIFVQPSEMEGLSLGLLEAMRYGNCVLVSDIPENLEAMAGHGYSFRSKNYKDLKRRLESLLSNPQLVAEKKKTAPRYVESAHSWDFVADEYEKLYLSLCYATPH
jgi:glycosyltransferase involved in cell wall biosynthesis